MNPVGSIGGAESQFGVLALGYDPDDYVSVDWIAEEFLDMNAVKQYFAADQSGKRVELVRGIPSAIPNSMLPQLIKNGAVVLTGERFAVSITIRVFDSFVISDFSFATVRRTEGDFITITDAVIAGSRLVGNRRIGVATKIVAMQFAISAQVGTKGYGQLGAVQGETPETVKISDAATHSPHS